MARVPIGKHGRDHRPDGHDPIPGLSALVTTDGTTSVNPTTTLDILAPLSLTSPGGGLAEVGLALPTQQENFAFSPSSQSVAGSGGAAAFTLAHSSGASFLDYTTANQPKFPAKGLYWISGVLQMTPASGGVLYDAAIAVNSSTYGGSWSTSVPSLSGIGLSIGFSLLCIADVNDYFQVKTTNHDSTSVNYFLAAGLCVQLVTL